MNSLRIALAQINTTVGDVAGNALLVRQGIERARGEGAELVVFPEATLPGYPADDLVLKTSFVVATQTAVAELAPSSRGLTVLVGFVDDVDGGIGNAVAILHDGRHVGTVLKHHLPNYGVFDERRYFTPATRPVLLCRGGVRLGLTICEDIWIRPSPAEIQCRDGGADILVNLSASPYAIGKPARREALFGALAAELGVHLLVCNLVGGQDELVFDGTSLAIGPDGSMLARASSFSEDLVVLDVPARVHASPPPDRTTLRTFEVEPIDTGDGVGSGRIRVAKEPAERLAVVRGGRCAPLAGVEETYAALVLGTRDYTLKNGFEHVVLGLSGGIDSALVAVVAADALGPAHVTAIGMPSPFSSPGSVTDARALSEALGIEFRVIEIDRVYEALIEALEPSFQGLPFGLAEENLQARVRGNLLMALSNKFGWLVLTTGNKSETAVGYSTLYGDTAGGFAVIKDLYKTSVYEHARHRNASGAVIPESILTKAPSAELRPDQKDSDSLPPYDVLDRILVAYVERDQSIDEIASEETDRELVARVTGLVDRAEYKRRQSPPGIKITTRAFGKDRRLPITNRWGG